MVHWIQKDCTYYISWRSPKYLIENEMKNMYIA